MRPWTFSTVGSVMLKMPTASWTVVTTRPTTRIQNSVVFQPGRVSTATGAAAGFTAAMLPSLGQEQGALALPASLENGGLVPHAEGVGRPAQIAGPDLSGHRRAAEA